MVDLRVKIHDIEFKNPVTVASGTFGFGEEMVEFVDVNKLGGIYVKGLTLENREGNDYPRMAETASGMLNAVGLQNKGIDYFIDHIYPNIKDFDTHIIANVIFNGRSIYIGNDVSIQISKISTLTSLPM